MMNYNFNSLSKNKNKIIKEEDINISITDEHNEQEITSMGETGKSIGITSVMNLPHLTISTTNKQNFIVKCKTIQFIIKIIFLLIQILIIKEKIIQYYKMNFI